MATIARATATTRLEALTPPLDLLTTVSITCLLCEIRRACGMLVGASHSLHLVFPTDSNSNGSYYYSNDNGSTYYNSGTGYSNYTPPGGK